MSFVCMCGLLCKGVWYPTLCLFAVNEKQTFRQHGTENHLSVF